MLVMIGTWFIGDITGDQVLIVAIISMLATLIPMVGGLVILAIQQYGRIREALALANADADSRAADINLKLDAVHKQVQASTDTVLGVINGGSTGPGSDQTAK